MPTTPRFGPDFPKIFLAALLQEVSFALLVHFPGHLDDLGATASLIGVLYGAAAVAGLAVRPGLGRILDLTRRRTVLLVGGAGNSMVVLALALATRWGLLLWSLFVAQRMLQIAIFTAMLTYAADSLPVARRTQGLALFGLSGLIPIGLGGVLGEVIIAAYGFVGLFVAAGLAELLSVLVIWGLPTLPVMGRRPRRGFWAALVQRNLLPLYWATLCFSAGLETIFTFTRTYVDNRQIGSAGLFFGVYGGAAALTRTLGGSRYDRLPQRAMIVSSIAAYGAGLVLMALAEGDGLFVAAAATSGVAHGAIFPILSSQVVLRARVAERGSAMSIFTSVFEVAVLLFAPAVGLLIDGFSYQVGFGAAGLGLLAGGLVYALWDSRMAIAEAAV